MRTGRWLVALLSLVVCSSAVAQTNTIQSYTIVRKTGFDGAVTFEIMPGQDYPAYRRDVDVQNQTMDDVFNDLRREWNKRHDREILKTTRDEKGVEKQYMAKAPVPPFPLTRPPECRVRPVTQCPTLETAEAKKKELAEKEPGLAGKTSKPQTDGPAAGGRDLSSKSRTKRPEFGSRARSSDGPRRAEDGYLPDDLTEEQLHAELLARVAAKPAPGHKAPDPAAKPDK
jgi:hypothetical protein